ncbi:MAG: ABC transporter permease [Anaerolineae bacterium]|nr:ABC transporter permease [Anaerolineae bacterium]
MFRFIVRRLAFIVLVALAIVFFVFLGLRMARNSTAALPDYRMHRHARLAAQETWRYLRQAVHGDFGTVQQGQRTVEVREVLRATYPKSLGLLGAALLLAVALGLIAGTLAALRQHSPFVFLLLTLTVLGISTPSFFAAMLLQVANVKSLQSLNFRLAFSGGFGWDWRHMLFPSLVLAARPLAYVTRVAFITLSAVLGEDYIRTAWAKGLNLRQVLNGHALRNAAVPMLTAAGISLRFSLGSLPVVEYFFNWPGLGNRLLEAIRAGQPPLVATLALALGLTFLGINLLLDVAYRIIDPRLRE